MMDSKSYTDEKNTAFHVKEVGSTPSSTCSSYFPTPRDSLTQNSAATANNAERPMTLRDGLRLYPKAIA